MKCWADVQEGSREQKVCLRMVQMLLQREGNDWGWSTFGLAINKRNSEMIEKVQQMLAQDQRLTLRLIVEELGISKDTAHTIVHDDLGKQKIFSWFVPHKLTDKQKAKQMETSGDFIFMCYHDQLLLENIDMGDETRYYRFDSESKLQSIAWCSQTSPQPKKESSAKIQGQNTVDCLLWQQRHHPWEICSCKSTINSAFYQALLNWLLQHIRRVRPESNRAAYSTIHVHQFLAQKMVAVLDHPAYYPDLASEDFFLFPHLKAANKGARFADVNSIKDRVTAVLWSTPQEAFADCFLKL